MTADRDGTSDDDEGVAATPFPIVGVGASAGGLEAFTQLLGALPPGIGMGFVLVQHLDPDHESQLTEILGRATSLPVTTIVDNERVEPNHVYVIPRDTRLTINEGVLSLQPRPRTRGAYRPIDIFFESLARDQRERAVGVVLSGTATDGTLGLEAIKAEGGITFAQDDTARHHSMPRSAVAAGCVDVVLSPEMIAAELVRIAKHPYVAGDIAPGQPEVDRASATAHETDDTALPSGGHGAPRTDAERVRAEAETGHGHEGYRKVLLLLRNHSGVDFSLYKSTTIQRRIGRRLVLNKLDTLDAYANFLRGNSEELGALYSDVLISVTSFFRNPEAFEVLEEKVLPELLGQPGDHPVRCWVLGCSTGQEAYSIAMAFVEAFDQAPRMRKLQIFATDLNEALLDKARHGLYAKSLAEDISPERLRRFFVEEEGGYRVNKALREMVVFARQNLVADPPFSRMDLISCRNLLIYLEPSLQKKALPTFHYALRPGGYLLLGASESIGTFTDLFEPLDKKHKIYSKKAAAASGLHLPTRPARYDHGEPARGLHPMPAVDAHDGGRGELDAQREADRITVNQFAPPAVLVNAELQILQFRGPTGAYLEPPLGKASFDVLKMAREGLLLPLRSAINEATKESRPARRDNLRVERDGDVQTVNLEVIPLRNLRERCLLIVFEEAEKAAGRRAIAPPVRDARVGDDPDKERIAALERENSEMREYLQTLQEQHDAANEEVQSANEEVQSANEELQSINEELETSKEELESTNEELTTINEEMSNRNVELNRVNNDLVNFQSSAKLAVLLLGRDLTIRRFSTQAEKQLELLITDIGRPISHIRHGLVELGPSGQTPLDIEGLAAEAIADLREQEREVLDKSGRWYSLRMRPYVTLDGRVDGTAMVLFDIDRLRRSEQQAEAAREYAESLIDTVRDPLVALDAELRVVSANRSFYGTFRVSASDTIGRRIYDLGNRQWDVPRLRELLEAIVPQSKTIEDFEVEHAFESIGQRTMLLNARQLHRAREGPQILLAIQDITEAKQAERARREIEAQHRTLVEQVKEYAIFRTDPRGRATTWNEGVERVLGFDRDGFVGVDIADTIYTSEDVADGVPQRELEIAARDGTASSDRWMQRKGGQRFAAAGVTSALRDDQGELAGFTKVMRDETAKVEKEETLRRYAADLADAAARKNEFLAMLGHELRNPLSALSHGLERLGTALADRERSEELRQLMQRQTGRIVTLVDQLLDLTRVISGKVELAQERVDLADVIMAAVETVQPLITAQRHDLRLALPRDRVFVIGDAVRLAQVVENLLANAAKYTNEGGRIELSVEGGDDDVRISVRDNGIGLTEELRPHVFEVFTQAPRTLDRAKGGLGLGLPLVQRLVERHGGRVVASSAGLGRGSEFVVTLPRLRAADAPEGRAVEATRDTREKAARRVLIVDDERDLAETLAELLETEGHEALAVYDGASALDAVRSFVPDIVLLDLGLPDLDGYEVARRLRDEHGDKKPKLVAVTGYRRDAARLAEAGFDQHLLKPSTLHQVTALVAALGDAQ